MRVRIFLASLVVLALLVAFAGLSAAQKSSPQAVQSVQANVGTTFTYQGRLTDGGAPANGT